METEGDRLKADLIDPATGRLLLSEGAPITPLVTQRIKSLGLDPETLEPLPATTLLSPETAPAPERPIPPTRTSALNRLLFWIAMDMPLDDWDGLVHWVEEAIGELDPFDASVAHGDRVPGDHERTHPVNVMLLSVRMAQAMGFPATVVREVAIGALLHDLGKLQVEPEIRFRPGGLSPEQMRRMREHPRLGLELLRVWGLMDRVSPLVLDAVGGHHERVDGRGYPAGLAGAMVPEVAGIVAIAEAYDSLVSDCLYRRRFPPGFAYQLIRRGTGSRFAPHLVKAFERAIWPYPPHSQVRLADGTIAKVVPKEVSSPLQPWVQLPNQQILLATGRFAIVDAHVARSAERFPIRIPASITVNGLDLFRSETLDLSQTGARLLDPHRRVNPATDVEILLKPPHGTPTPIEGRVVWIKPLEHGGMPFGVRLAPSSALSQADLKRLWKPQRR
jgi:hypothetical protein